MSDTQSRRDDSQRRGSRFGFGLIVVLLVLWSAFAWGAYELADWAIGWLSASTDTLIETGKDAAGQTGVGKDIVDAVEAGRNSGLYDQILAAIRFLTGPAIVAVWALGALAILALGFFGRILSGLIRR